MINRFLLWLVMNSPIPLERLAPWVLGLAMGRRPHRVEEDK